MYRKKNEHEQYHRDNKIQNGPSPNLIVQHIVPYFKRKNRDRINRLTKQQMKKIKKRQNND